MATIGNDTREPRGTTIPLGSWHVSLQRRKSPGTGGYNRRVSLNTALEYGKSLMWSQETWLELPTTRFISASIFSAISGCSDKTRKSCVRVLEVVSRPATIKLRTTSCK